MKGTALELLEEYAQIRAKMILNFGTEILTDVEMLVMTREIKNMKGGAKDEDKTVTDSEHA